MKVSKKIADLIDEPRIGDVEEVDVVGEQSVEIQGVMKDKFEIEPRKYTYIELSDSVFIDLLANNVTSFRSSVIRCRFKNAQLTGLQLPQSNFKDVIFENCRLTLANFRSSTFERCIFKNCDLTETDFGSTHFTKVLFEACIVEQTEFSNCVNKRLEFESTALHSVHGISGLKGAIISENNLIEIAPLLASELGIDISIT